MLSSFSEEGYLKEGRLRRLSGILLKHERAKIGEIFADVSKNLQASAQHCTAQYSMRNTGFQRCIFRQDAYYYENVHGEHPQSNEAAGWL